MKSFQDKLTDGLIKSKLSQHELAAKLDIHQTTVSRWADGSVIPNKTMQTAVLAALKKEGK